MAEPIEIVIRKTQETAQQTSVSTPSSNKSSTNKTVNNAINVALVNAGKQIVSTGINQYGNLTGNTLMNKQLDNVNQIAGYVGQVLVGGWVGAIAVAGQVTAQGINDFSNRRRANQEAEMLYERSGNVTINGGRGTND